MESYGIHELQRRPGEILDQVERDGRPAVVTRHGKPAAVLLPIGTFEDWVLANAPEHVSDLRAADKDVLHDQTRPASDVLAEIRGEA